MLKLKLLWQCRKLLLPAVAVAIAIGLAGPLAAPGADFTAVDIGNPAVAGTVTPAAGGFDITAGGTNIFGNTDQFTFYYQQITGDFDVQVRVAALALTDAWAKAGLMARETTNAGSRYAGSFATPSVSGVLFQSRLGTNTVMAGQFPVNYPDTWLRLRKVGNVFTGYASADGQNWATLGSSTLTNSAQPLLVGLAVTAANVSQTVRAQYRDYGDSTGGTIGAVALPVEPIGPSSRKTGMIISEIMYHPRFTNELEFVELFNANSIFQDLSGFRLAGDIEFTFPTNTIVPSGGFVVIARNPSRVQTVYGISGVLGPWLGDDGSTVTNALPDDEGRVRLRNPAGAVLLEVNYQGALPWPIAADGAGHSLVLARPSYGEDDPRAWAASARIGGSPGTLDPIPVDHISTVVINEFLANSPDPVEDFVELYNAGNASVDLSGAWLSDDRDTNKFQIPDGTTIPARGFVSFNQSTLGFALSSGGERIYLVNSNQTRVIDAHAFEAQALGVSSGRYPDGAASPGFHELVSRTPGAANTRLRIGDIVINELMYHPVSEDDDEEFVELYNRSNASVDVSGWRFTAGINYTIPANTIIASNGYLVIAKDLSRVLTNYPQLNAANARGNYGGQLANGGERVALAMPEYLTVTNGSVVTTNATNYIVVDEVIYQDGGRWGTWADGGGSSLELIDPGSDNRLAPNWADSDETAKGQWTTVDHSEVMDHVYPRGAPGADLNEVQVMILGAGEALLDDVEVRSGATGTNRVANGDFASGLTGWVIQGNHVKSTLEAAGPNNPSASLHLRASAGGDNGANRVEKDLLSALTVNTIGNIRAKLRWLRGHPDVLLRLHGGGLETVVTLPLPRNLGSPGLPNSRRLPNAGPAIYNVNHHPVLPAANQPVVITANVSDTDGITTVQTQYRLDPSGTLAPLVMRDDGTGSDTLANDGVYSATLPGQPSGTLVAFRIQATGAGTPVTTLFPQDAPARECLVRFGDPTYAGNIGIYRMWMTAANISAWTSRERLSNEALDGTLVYNNYRVIYNAAARYRGSPFIRPGYNGPTGSACGYVWTLPDDDLFLGEDELNLDSLEPGGRDSTALREITSFTILEQLGYPSSYQRFVHVVINGINNTSRNIPIYSDSQQPNADYIESWFPNDSDGEIFKIDDWFEFDDAVARQANKSASLQNFTTTGGVKKKARYRWCWEKKSNGSLNDDYSSLFDSVDAINAPDSIYIKQVESMFEIEGYLAALAFRHVVGDWDGYGYNRGKNQFTYRPRGGKFWMLMWDLDFAIGCNGGHPPTQNLFEVSLGGDTGENNMPEISRMYLNPHFRRIYLRGLQRMADGPLRDANFMPILDARYRALQANGIVQANGAPTTSPYVGSGAQGISIPAWIQQRRANILSQIPAVNFALTTTNNVTTSNNVVTISGTAPVMVRSITVNGQEYPVTWTGSPPITWTLRLVVSGNTTVSIQGLDIDGNPITTNRVVNIIYTGPPPPSPEDLIVFSEIMYNPQAPDASFVEILNTSPNSFNLSGWRVNGLDFTFPLGSIITNGQVLVLAKDHVAFARAYGFLVPVTGEFDGNLDLDGETLSLIKPGATSAEDVIVDRVRYEPGEPWLASANGGGPSLQLLDPAQDNARVSNWGDGGGWKYFSSTANLNAGTNHLFIYLAAVAEIYFDDLVLVAGTVPEAGPNLIRNGDFEGPLLMSEGGPWSFSQASLSNTVISSSVKHSGNGSLRLVHQVAGPTSYLVQSNVIVSATGQYTISVWYLPITNDTTLTLRVNSFYRPAINVRAILSTPGLPNVRIPLPPYPPLWLNELQPNNLSGIRDASNTPEPWIELYNAGTNTLSLAGLFLANNYASNLTQWPFPSDAAIAPGEFKIIWADGDPEETSGTNLHTSFRLHPSSGTIALTRLLGNDPQILDYLTYDEVAPTLSYGDYPDGQPFYRTVFYTVTPGATNEAQPGAIFINEWLAGNQGGLRDPADGDPEDWFELFNPNDVAIDLGGYYLSDTLTNRTQYRIPNGYSVPARGFLLVWADNESGQNNSNRIDLHASFALARTGEALALFGPDGALIDGIAFGNQTNDVSEGRYPDGSPHRYFMSMPTPRTNNVVPGLNNTPPILGPIANRTIDEGRRLSFRAMASDFDVPAQSLSFSLDAGAPTGAQIMSDGNFRWTPNEAQGPGLYPITVRVTDNGSPVQSDTKTFEVTVREVNRTPYLSNTQSKHVKAGETLSFLTGFDGDIPANALSFMLGAAPAGISLDPVTGRLTWMPTDEDAPGVYAVNVQVADNGVPPLSNSHNYRVYVYESTNTVIVAQLTREGENVRLSWPATLGAQYEVDYKDSIGGVWQTHPAGVIVAGGMGSLLDSLALQQRFYRVRQLPPP